MQKHQNPSGSHGLQTEGGGKKKETEIGTKKGKVKTSFRLYVNAGKDGGMKKRW